MTQSSHGPFGSGHHHWTKQQTAELLAESITAPDFENLKESMTRDRYGDTSGIPETPSDLPDIPSVASLPIFAAWIKSGDEHVIVKQIKTNQFPNPSLEMKSYGKSSSIKHWLGTLLFTKVWIEIQQMYFFFHQWYFHQETFYTYLHHTD